MKYGKVLRTIRYILKIPDFVDQNDLEFIQIGLDARVRMAKDLRKLPTTVFYIFEHFASEIYTV